ncbi:ATP-binding protein [Thauera sp. 63]|uniref:ATP-binding protein n=1 Tax=Thauera sp. 63 TaxID=497321 RepID=UPI0002CF797E|nr:ATP-binding protein [Thauera sp. 63]ENO80458.1 AAA ATPase [Thauera sp. 63]
MNAPLDLDWSTANQRLLVLEFARLHALLGDEPARADELDRLQVEADALRARQPAPPAIDVLAQRFGLSPFERDVVLLCAGCEMDGLLAARCAEAQGQTAPWPSFGLALAALPEPHWSALAPQGPLRTWQLLSVDDGAGLTGGRLRITENVLHFLAGLGALDARLAPLLEPVSPPALMCPEHALLVERLLALQDERGRLPGPIVFHGDDPDGQQDVAVALAERLGLSLFRLRATDLPASATDQDALARLWQRDAMLLGSALLLTHAEGAPAATVERFVGRNKGFGRLICIAGRAPVFADAEAFAVNHPDAPAQCRLWRQALAAYRPTLSPTPAFDALASHYRLSARRIAALAERSAAMPDDVLATRLRGACRSQASAMGSLAQAIEPCASWNDLILPDAQHHALRQIETHVRHRLTVHHDWGFAGRGARGLGIATLFWGDSGTGKTMAAEVLANSLQLALFRIDLSAVVSKYIGETEKNLRQVFDAAEESGAILLFDEADALFGKRSEVKDSHDRYANIEVSYLLQRMEAYRGLAILTTNHKTALDHAFARRLRFVVHFPFPDERQREALWRSVFPSATPLDALDYAKLARLAVPGGSIRNIALAAAFLAAEAGTAVGMAHLLHAAHAEAAKRDKPVSEAETRGWL